MSFENRYLIRGTLMTQSSLHIGDGSVWTRPDVLVKNQERRVQIAAVATDHRGRAYLPGSTLKGNLRAFCVASGAPPGLIDPVFGSLSPGAEGSVGGKAEFWDAPAHGGAEFPIAPPYMDAKRRTAVAAFVALSRRTRSASEERLFHHEYVPAGLSFLVRISGQDLSDAEVGLLLHALTGFSDADHPIRLGAGGEDGWGRMRWQRSDVLRMTRADVTAWLAEEQPRVGYGALRPLSVAEADALCPRYPGKARKTLEVPLEIRMQGPFLVNDPAQCVGPDAPNHAPLRDLQGRVVLPASSLRGALRAQAERITRTLAGRSCDSTSDAACRPIDERAQVEDLCLTCQVFGAPGWRSPIAVSEFVAQGEGALRTQQFLAIDRFLGGGADGLKFDARYADRPVLLGTLRLDLDRLPPWALGLLAYVLRDLAEGDIPLGFGAAKGYGACQGRLPEGLSALKAHTRAFHEKVRVTHAVP